MCAPFFNLQQRAGSMRRLQPVVRKRRVFKLKEKPIDANTLGVILDRRARRAQVGR